MDPEFEGVERVIHETKELINDRDKFDDFLEGFKESVEQINQRRLCKWFSFFNTNYFQNPCIYSYCVFALFDAVERNELFKTQSEYEFEISRRFYEEVFNAKSFISIGNLETARQLLNISLVYGKYPGMQLRSIRKAIDLLKDGVNENTLNLVFEFLFVKYENPKILSYNLSNLSLNEIDILMFVLQGNNISNHPDIPTPISKKESYFLINKIENLRFEDNVLKRSIISAKLILKSNNVELLPVFFQYSRIFEFQINTFVDDIDFWCDVYNLLLKIDWESTNLSIQEFMDYFEHIKYNSNKEFTLKGRSVKSIIRAINNWHEGVDFAAKMELINLSWKGNGKNEYRIYFEEEIYLFREITNGEELYRESDEMRHCAFSYIESCSSNYCSLWSMKKEVSGSFSNHLTIEVRNKQIVQIGGKRNQKPKFRDELIIMEWSKMAEITFAPGHIQ